MLFDRYSKLFVGMMLACAAHQLFPMAATTSQPSADTEAFSYELMNALFSRDYDGARILLSMGVHIHALTEPLRYAAALGDEDFARMLLGAGALVGNSRKHDGSPLTIAASYGHTALVKLFLEVGSAVDELSSEKETALYIACSYGYEEIAQILVDAGAHVCPADTKRSALVAAASVGNERLVRVMVTDAHADINQPGCGGYTPLMAAAMNGRMAIVTYLVEQGADIKLLNDGKKTAFDLAKEWHQDAVVAYLESCHAKKDDIK